MKLKIHYTTQLKADLGMDSEEVEVPDGSRFSDIVAELSKRHAAAFRRLVVDENGDLLPSILPCVDDEQISPDDNPMMTDGGSVTSFRLSAVADLGIHSLSIARRRWISYAIRSSLPRHP